MCRTPRRDSRVSCVAMVLLAAGVAAGQPPAEPAVSAEAAALLDKLDAARLGPERKPDVADLEVSGSFTFSFGGAASEPIHGAFTIAYQGAKVVEDQDFRRFGRVRQGTDGRTTWEIHPVTGPEILHGDEEGVALRAFATVRWPGWRAVYRRAEIAAERDLDDRPCTVLKLGAASGEPDVWYLDDETSLPRRIVFVTPTLRGEAPQPLAIDYLEWQRVGGIAYPRVEKVTARKAAGSFTYEKVVRGATIDAARFEFPPEIRKLAEGIAPAGKTKRGFELQERKPQPVAVIRERVPLARVHAATASALAAVLEHLALSGIRSAGEPFARFHDEKDGMVDLEAGIPVERPVEPKGRIAAGELPGGRLAVTWHLGSFDELAGARAALKAWIAGQGLKPRGGPWEVYLSDPAQERDSKRWHTQILWPVE